MTTRPLEFRDPARAERMRLRLEELVGELGGEPVTLMHVCGSHEQAIARYGLRDGLPAGLEVIMGPGCPVCVTNAPEVDAAVAMALQGMRVVTYGDMLRVPGTTLSLDDVRGRGGRVDVVYGITQAVELARENPDEALVFFATGFETTAVATAAALLAGVPANFFVLSAHKFVPPAMELVASIPESQVRGFLAAGHAATITGWGLFKDFARRHETPVVVAGFEPLDILAAMALCLELIRDGRNEVVNAYPRCVSEEGNRVAQEVLWSVFAREEGEWRGVARVPEGNLTLRPEHAAHDALLQFPVDLSELQSQQRSSLSERCICGSIMTGLASPEDCAMFRGECTPQDPVGACMVSAEGSCRIWHQYGSPNRLGAPT